MNKKGKNKRNKNNPVQNVQDKSEEINQEVVEIVESVERVPEILTDVAPVPEVRDDTPKKPKRNRGKKKKGKDDDEETTREDNVGTIKDVPVDSIEEKPAEIITVVPTTRKNKNKSKNNEPAENVETVPKDILTENLLNLEVKEDTIESLPVQEDKEDLKPEPQQQEAKTSKKKNKKKKRNDSEKSDKEDVSCTAAFQTLLAAAELEDKTENKGGDELALIDIHLGAEIIEVKLEKNKDVESENNRAPVSIEMSSNDDNNVKEAPTLGIKSKKKNKKDKRHPKVEDSLEDEVKAEQPSNNPAIKTPTENITEETKDKTSAPLESLVEATSLTPKAKIAKPVEKKRKEKLEAKDNASDLTINKEIEQATEIMETKQATIEVVDILDIPFTSEPPRADDMTTDELVVPDNAMGKKRKKSQKPPKVIESSEIHEQVTDVEPKITQSDSSNAPVCLPVEIPSEYADQVCAKADNAVKPVQDTKLITVTDILLTSSNLTEAKDTTEDKPPKQKSGKKGRKSPRPTKHEEIKSEQPSHQAEDTKKLDTQALTEQLEELTIKASKKEESSNGESQANIKNDIEIRSLIADESEGSTCEVTPDVLYPRSSSQQHLDNNNNMVIRELLPSDNILDMPIVLGCVDVPKTPEPTPKKIIEASTSKSTKPFKMSTIGRNVGIKADKEEKTDLKSKMMEVNQDMEELRLSIEKSLAELTSIEKSEDTVEKMSEETKVADDSKAPEMKTESLVFTETPVSLLIEPNIASDKLVKVKIDEIGNTSNIKEPSPFSKDPKPVDIPKIDEIIEAASLSKDKSFKILKDSEVVKTPLIDMVENITSSTEKDLEVKETSDPIPSSDTPPVCPTRKDNKGKHKKKKGKQDSQSTVQSSNVTTSVASTSESKDTKETKKDDKTEAKSDNKEKGKQQADGNNTENEYEPIDNFEDALTSSVDDVNKTFEMIVNEGNEQTNPKINIIAPDEEKKTKVQPPKNLLGHPDIPVQSNKFDYKKEKNKTPNESQAKVKIKDAVDVDKRSKNTQTISKMVKNSKNDSLKIDSDYVYKYNFRKVFLQSACHVCKKELKQRVACAFCNLVFYCSIKHKDEDWPHHQALCFAISTIVHLKDQKHIYSDVQNITGHDYRLVRMQMIVSCEKVLKRRLVPWEQEALLYPRMCALVGCREWRQGKLKDCEGCGQGKHTSNLKNHLSVKHIESYRRVVKQNEEYRENMAVQKAEAPVVVPVPNVHEDDVMKKLKTLCLKLVIVHGRPLSLLGDESFRKIICLAATTNRSSEITTNTMKTIILDVANELKQKVAAQIQNKMISLKLDSVTCVGRKYLGVNIQYIHNSQITVRNLLVLEINEQLATDVFQDKLFDVLNEVMIRPEQIYSVSTDNDNNVKRVTRLTYNDSIDGIMNGTDEAIDTNELKTELESDEEEPAEENEDPINATTNNAAIDAFATITSFINNYDNIRDFRFRGMPCLAQSVELVIKSALAENADVKSTLQIARMVVIVLRKNIDGNRSNVKLPKIDSPTRWITIYKMLKRLRSFQEQCDDMEEVTECVSSDFWVNLEVLINCLEPFYECTVILQKELLTIGDFYIAWMKCKAKIASMNNSFAANLKKAMETTEKALLDTDAVLETLYLDGRLNVVLSDQQCERARTLLDQTMKQVQLLKDTSQSNESNLSNATLNHDTSQDMEDTNGNPTEDVSKELSLIEEMLVKTEMSRLASKTTAFYTYLLELRNSVRLPLSTNIVVHWKDKSLNSDIIDTANTVLATPATHATVNKLFATLKFMLSPERGYLSPNLLQDMMFIRSNQELLDT